ncbi:MAG: ribosome silencing factor [Burkholderiaceae bacterium]|nr:ribosome silencing factor [Burkholderiaceae bacterium]
MRTSTEGAKAGTPPRQLLSDATKPAKQLEEILHWLDEAKAEKIVSIDLEGKSSLGDYMVIATGRSDRHVGAIAEQLHQKLKDGGSGRVRVEGLKTCDWVLIDTGDIIVHVFRPEVREFYNLEKLWLADRPGDTSH